MRHTCISAVMAVVVVVTGAGSARAQQADVPQRLVTSPGSGKVKAAVAFGLIGMGAGAAIGSQATKNCGCEGGAGAFYGVLIGTPLGVWLGAWLAGR